LRWENRLAANRGCNNWISPVLARADAERWANTAKRVRGGLRAASHAALCSRAGKGKGHKSDQGAECCRSELIEGTESKSNSTPPTPKICPVSAIRGRTDWERSHALIPERPTLWRIFFIHRSISDTNNPRPVLVSSHKIFAIASAVPHRLIEAER
jgi:hypothetical protein